MDSTIFQIILHILTFLTVLVQGYVIFLVQCKSPTIMQEYRFFLNIFTTYDIIFTILIGVLLQPNSVPNLLAARAQGLSSYLGPQGILITACAAVYAGANVVMTQDYCLTYRFTVVYPNKNIHKIFMTPWYKAANLIFHQIVSIFLATFLYQILLKHEDLFDYLAQQPQEVMESIKPGEFILGINIYSKLSPWFMSTMLISFTLSEILCITLIYLILTILRKNAALYSRKTYKLHIQYTILLATQLMTPFVFIILPVAACLIAALFGLYSPQLAGQLGFIMITLYGVTNSLFTIILIGPYRRHAYEKIIIPILKISSSNSFSSKKAQISSISTSMMRTINATPNFRRPTRSGSLYATPVNRLP